VLYCLNLPLEIHFLQENVFLASLIPLSNEATVWGLNHLLPHFVHTIMEFDNPGQILATWSHPGGVPVAARVYPNIADLLASKKWIGFGSPMSNYYCTYCLSHRNDIDNLDSRSYVPRDSATVKFQAMQWKNSETLEQKKALLTQTGVQYSPIIEIPYFDPVQHTVLGVMHNRLEGDLQHHLRVLWGVGRTESQQKEGAIDIAGVQKLESEDEGEYLQTDSEEAESELESLRDETAAGSTSIYSVRQPDNRDITPTRSNDRDATPTGSMEINTTPTRSNFPPLGSLASLAFQAGDWDMLELGEDADDLEYIPKSTNLFEFTAHQLGQIRLCIQNIFLPSWVERPPRNLGEKSHGKLKAHEYFVLFAVIFPLIMPELWITAGEEEKRHLECFCHLVASTNISMSYTTSNSEADKYTEHYVQYCNMIKSLYPSWASRPNHHYGMHIGDLLKFWGPLACLSEFPGERLNGELASIQTNNHFSKY
jgi:hypothetical protein